MKQQKQLNDKGRISKEELFGQKETKSDNHNSFKSNNSISDPSPSDKDKELDKNFKQIYKNYMPIEETISKIRLLGAELKEKQDVIKELQSEIDKLIKQKQDIIKKEGYPASDVIAVLREEIKQELIEEFEKMIDNIETEYPDDDGTPFRISPEQFKREIKQQLQNMKEKK